MSDVQELSLLTLVEQHDYIGRTLIVKDIPEECDLDTLVNYLEVVVRGNDVEAYYFPSTVRSVGLFMFKESLPDISQIQEKLQKKTLFSKTLTAQHLTEAEGLFITDLPAGTPQDMLELFFEHKSSGGCDGCADNVDIFPEKKMAVIQFDPNMEEKESVMLRILHNEKTTNKYVIHPYFKDFHQLYIELLQAHHSTLPENKKRAQPKQQNLVLLRDQEPLLPSPSVEGYSMVTNTFIPVAKVTPPPESMPAMSHRHDMPPKGKNQPRQENKVRQVPSNLMIFDDSDDADDSTSFTSSPSPNHQSMGTPYTQRTQTMGTPYTQRTQTPRKSKSRSRKKSGPAQPSPESFENDIIDATSNPLQMGNIQSHTPGRMSERPSPSPGTIDRGQGQHHHINANQSQGHRGQQAVVMGMVDIEKVVEQKVSLSKEQISLLIIKCFSKNCKECKVWFNKDAQHATFTGAQRQVEGAQIQMHKILQQVLQRNEPLSPTVADLLERKESVTDINNLLKKQKIYAVGNVKDGQFICWAFREDDMTRGIELIRSFAVEKEIELREGQDRVVKSADWFSFTQKVEEEVKAVCIKGDAQKMKVYIAGYNDRSVLRVRAQVVDHLRKSTSQISDNLILSGAKSRCFLEYFKHDLQEFVRGRHGKLQVKTSHVSVEVIVFGSAECRDALSKAVNGIWHERINFRKISEDDEDIQLLLRGLKKEGILQDFEKKFGCFIDVEEEKEIARKRSDTKKTVNKSDHSYCDWKSNKDRDSPARREDSPDSFFTTEGSAEIETERPSEDDAVRLAMEFSLEEAKPNIKDQIQDLRSHSYLSDAEEEEEDFAPFPIQPIPHYPLNPCYRKPTQTGSQLMGGLQDNQARTASSKSTTFGTTRVLIKDGDIIKEKSDVLVNIVGPLPNREFQISAIAKFFSKAAGPGLQQLYERQKQVMSGACVIQTTSTGNLQCQHVLHVSLVKGDQKSVSTAIKECLQECRSLGVSSIAFPPLGCGRLYGFRERDVARSMISELKTELTGLKYQQLTSVTLVAHGCADTFVSALRGDNLGSPLHRYQGIQGNQRTHPAADPFQIPKAFPQPSPYLYQDLQGQLNPFSRPQMVPNTSGSSPTVLDQRRDVLRTGAKSSASPVRKDFSSASNESCRQRSTTSPTKQYVRPPTTKRRQELPMVSVTVFGKNKGHTEVAKNDIGKTMKEQFLYEEEIERKGSLSAEAKQKIKTLIDRNNIVRLPGKTKNRYVIRGHKDDVNKTYIGILKIVADSSSAVPQRNRTDFSRKTVQFNKFMAVEEDSPIPSYWKHYQPGSPVKNLILKIGNTLKGSHHHKVTISQNAPEYVAIENMIKYTWNEANIGHGVDAKNLGSVGHKTLVVQKIERIENIKLYDEFIDHRKKLFLRLFHGKMDRFPRPSIAQMKTRKCGKTLKEDMLSEVNEYLFFHGTKDSIVEAICDQGFDNRLGNTQAMLGGGVYGAESSTKADQYTDERDKRTPRGTPLRMFLIRMLLGNAYVYNKDQNPPKYRRPPCTTATCLSDRCGCVERFDSVIGDMGKLFREFVVYNASQCYPEYLITYVRQ